LVLTPESSRLNVEITLRRARIVQSYVYPGSSIVEVGPGSGDLSSHLSERGFKMTVVEHSAPLADHLRKQPGIAEVLVGDFAAQDFQAAAFDAYCSFHVIEHVIDVNQHLTAARLAVKPGGVAVIATPNTAAWEHQLPFALSPNFDSSHFQLFSAKALLPVLHKAGWEVITVITPSYPLASLRVVTKVLRRLRRQDAETTGGAYAKSNSVLLQLCINVFAVLTWPLRKVQEILLRGNELLIVARRID
jgi:2-polyprenyl-3-methyl-5-hydroxy-6-metoxy-1,4-benzoquinol methylase